MRGAKLPSGNLCTGESFASGRKSWRKQVRSLLAGPLTAASIATISWSRVAVAGQDGMVAWGSWAPADCRTREAAMTAREYARLRIRGIVPIPQVGATENRGGSALP